MIEPPTLSPEGNLDFQAIYKFAQVPSTAFTAEQTLGMLKQLPPDMPLEMKRQTVQVTLTTLGTAIGANRNSIVADADQKRDALHKYAEVQGKKTDQEVSEAEAQIAELQRQIAAKESHISVAKGKQERIETLCGAEAAHLESVLSFFGEESLAAPSLAPIILEPEPSTSFILSADDGDEDDEDIAEK